MAKVLIDSRSPIPLHVQVEQWVRQLIDEPKHQQGELLPDELSLAAQLGVSRGTVRVAISRLVAEGLLERRAGIGTRAIRRPAESAIGAWRSLTGEMAAKGTTVETYRLDCRLVAASADAATALLIDSGTRVFRLDRLRGWNATPILHSRSWFHPRLKLKGTEEFHRPLYDMLERATGVVADSAREELLAVSASATMARLLQVARHAPLLLRRHVVLDRGRRPFEFAEVHYVSQRYTLTIDLQRGAL